MVIDNLSNIDPLALNALVIIVEATFSDTLLGTIIFLRSFKTRNVHKAEAVLTAGQRFHDFATVGVDAIQVVSSISLVVPVPVARIKYVFTIFHLNIAEVCGTLGLVAELHVSCKWGGITGG